MLAKRRVQLKIVTISDFIQIDEIGNALFFIAIAIERFYKNRDEFRR
jgi:hypothetical protein